MGQIQNKCSCLCKNEEKNTFQLEAEGEAGSNHNTHQNIFEDKYTFQDNFLKSKSRSQVSSYATGGLNNFPNGNFIFSFMNEEDKTTISKEILNSQDLKDNYIVRYIVMIQKIWKGWLYRKKFPQYKIALIKLEDDKVRKYEKLFMTDILIKSERESKFPYDKLGWKKFYNDGSLFEYNYGKVFFKKILIYGEEAFYSGEINIDNQKHGFGVLIRCDGLKSEGYWQNDCFTGWGRVIDYDGVIFQGCFIDGLLNGKGERIATKSDYTGDFKNGLRHGLGKEETDEHRYYGEYQNDKKQGKGKLIYKKIKDIYEGEFSENNITGYGVYTWANQDTFQGTFLTGKMHGSGVYRWPDGGEYYGDYVHNIKHGHGRFKWPSGKIFEGPFINGKPNGIGKLIVDDLITEVLFKDGTMIKDASDGPFDTEENHSSDA